MGSCYSKKIKDELDRLERLVREGKLSLEEALKIAKQLRHVDLKRQRS
jgi:hypothetical protein